MPHPLTDPQLRVTYRETIDRLYGYVSRRCGGDRALTEDVTQETWLRAVREWRNKGMPEVPLAWLTTVAHNLLLNEVRKRRPLPLEDVSPAELMGAVEAGGASDSAEVAAMVNQALARLPDPQSRLLEAFHFDRIRCAQIAESLGISERAVEGRLRRARGRCAASWKQPYMHREVRDEFHHGDARADAGVPGPPGVGGRAGGSRRGAAGVD